MLDAIKSRIWRAPPPRAAEEGARMRLILQFTGLHFERAGNGMRKCAHMLAVLAIICFGLFNVGSSLLALFRRGEANLYFIRFVIWKTKSTVVQMFLFYWQLKGRLEPLLGQIDRPVLPDAKHSETPVYRTWAFGACVFTVLQSCTALHYWFEVYPAAQHRMGGSNSSTIVKAEAHEPIISTNAMNVASTSMFYLSMWTLTSTLVFYNVLLRRIDAEVREILSQLHALLVRRSEHKRDDGDHQFVAGFAALYNAYLDSVRKVRLTDRTFQVYLFVMVGSNVPSMIVTLFRLWLLLVRLDAESLGQFLFSGVPDAALCILELVALTALAARLHTDLGQFPQLVFEMGRLEPCPERSTACGPSNQLLALMSVASQQSPGLSLWGFATITKPLIFTVVSMVLTYLTVVLQMVVPSTV